MEVPQDSVLESLWFILYTSELFRIIGKHIVSYADDATICAVIPRPLSHPQAMESLNQDLAAINSWYSKWHIVRRQKPCWLVNLGPMLPVMVISLLVMLSLRR